MVLSQGYTKDSILKIFLGVLDVMIGWSDTNFKLILKSPLLNLINQVNISENTARLLLSISFLTSWIIIYGFMSELKIFGKRKNFLYIILSFMIAETAAIIGITPWVSLFIYTIMNIWSIGIFALMFFVGTWYFYIKRRGEWGTAASVASAYHEDIKSLKDDLAAKRLELIEVRNKIARTANPDTRVSLEQREQKIKDEIQSLRERIEELAESYKT